MSWRLDPTQTGLLIIDVQERLTPVIWEAPHMIKAIVTAIGVAHLFKLPIFVTEQLPNKLGPTVAPIRAALGENTPPARIKAVVSAALSFEPGELPSTILAVGIETHICVRQTVFDLREQGHDVRVLADAVSSRTEMNHRLALHELREVAGARITTVETFAWELLQRAEGETFKALLSLLK